MAYLLLHELAEEGSAEARAAMSEARSGRWARGLRLLRALADQGTAEAERSAPVTWTQRATADDLTRIPARVRVFIALHEVPDDAPVVALMAHAGVNETELREAMRDLALRDHEPEA